MSQFPLGVNGRRLFKRISIFPCPTCEELLCKTFLGSARMLSVISCLNFQFPLGIRGSAHSSATQFFRAAPAENYFERPPVILLCSQFSSVLISARGNRAPRIQAQLSFSGPNQSMIALQDLTKIFIYTVGSLLFVLECLRVIDYLANCLVCWLVVWLFGWLVDWLVSSSVGMRLVFSFGSYTPAIAR